MALLALVLVTAVWGVTFVQVKDAVEVYPLFAFLAVRFAIATATLAPFAAGRIRTLDRRGLAAGVALATVGLGMLSGIEAGSTLGDALVLGGALAYALQIVLMERYAPDYDAVAFTLAEMVAACVGFTAIAVVLGDLRMPHGSTVWGALLVTGVFASALAFLVQTWAQRRTSATRTALAF